MRTAIVADDEPITRLDISQMLEELGFQVLGQASDGFDAVELCRAHHPDVALLDVRMPIFDGLGAAETIVNEELSGCVILLTAFSDPELVERAGKAGVTGYLVKPVDQRLILPTVEVAIAQSRRLRESRRESAQAKEKLEELKFVERAKGILASQRQISEMQAYQELRRMAMNKRCPVGVLARAVVESCGARPAFRRDKERLMELLHLSERAAYARIRQAAQEKDMTPEQAAAWLAAQAAEEQK